MDWPTATNAWGDSAAVWRFVGKRRGYNSWRRTLAVMRQLRVCHLYWRQQMRQAEIARALGVSPGTICRDLAVIARALQEPGVPLAIALSRVPPRRRWEA